MEPTKIKIILYIPGLERRGLKNRINNNNELCTCGGIIISKNSVVIHCVGKPNIILTDNAKVENATTTTTSLRWLWTKLIVLIKF